MRLDEETRIAKARRLWHLHVTGQWQDWLIGGIGGVALFLAFWMLGHGVGRFGAWLSEWPWWAALQPKTRDLISGVAFVSIGTGTFVSRMRRKPQIQSFFDLRNFVFEIAMVIGGILQIFRRGAP